MEEVDNRGNLVFCHVRGKYKCFQVEAIEEELDSIGSHNVLGVNDCFAFDYSHFDESEEEDESIEAGLTKCIEVLSLLEPSNCAESHVLLGLLAHFHSQRLVVSNESGLDFF